MTKPKDVFMITLTQLWDRYAIGKSGDSSSPQFNLLRWFSMVSPVVIATVGIGLGLISARVVETESIERDAMLSAQFIQSIASANIRHMALPTSLTMGEVMDSRQDSQYPLHIREALQSARKEFIEHISMQPDALLANIYGADGVILWSSNPRLMGKDQSNNDHLQQAFDSSQQVATSYDEVSHGREEQEFLRPPHLPFIENYIPLPDNQGNVASVVELYKDPRDLAQLIHRSLIFIWLVIVISSVLIYLGLLWMMRRASDRLAQQQRQLIANEASIVLEKISSATAHSLRTPMASIRSSAELAQELVEPSVQKNLTDIISQVDHMSMWVHELLASVSPQFGDDEIVEPLVVINECLHRIEPQIHNSGVRVEFTAETASAVISHRVLLALMINSLLGNAIGAMPNGGLLCIEVKPHRSGKRLLLVITDTGQGMTPTQEALALKPYYTAKHGGLGVGGLTMVKRIMERYGGNVSVNRCEHKGTRVCLYFKFARKGER